MEPAAPSVEWMCLQWEEKREVTGDGKDLGLSHLKNGITIYRDAEDSGRKGFWKKKNLELILLYT